MIEKKMNIRCMGCGANVEVDAFCQDGSRRKELICPECGMRKEPDLVVSEVSRIEISKNRKRARSKRPVQEKDEENFDYFKGITVIQDTN